MEKFRPFQCHEDNSFVKEELSEMSDTGVLVVDGNASKNCALLGGIIGSDGQRQWMVRNHHKWFGDETLRYSKISTLIVMAVHVLEKVRKKYWEKKSRNSHQWYFHQAWELVLCR